MWRKKKENQTDRGVHIINCNVSETSVCPMHSFTLNPPQTAWSDTQQLWKEFKKDSVKMY